jgi:inhibitor of KinA
MAFVAGAESGAGKVQLLNAGERGLVVELGTTIDPDVNARVHLLAAAISLQLSGEVQEVIPTYRSLLVVFDPLHVPRERLAARIEALAAEPAAGPPVYQGREVHIPVCYGGAFGPDLEFVAAHNGITPQQVIEIHSASPYLVYMLGFTPGFPYLGGLSQRIATPRLETPRTRVPAGSVGIAGEQTGIYPVESPGGWRLIGRTPLRLFDPHSAHPFLITAGDVLRFKPISLEEFEARSWQAAGSGTR